MGHFSRSVFCSTHTAYLLCSGWLNSTAFALCGGHPIVLASPKWRVILLQLGFTFLTSLSLDFFIVSGLNFFVWLLQSCHCLQLPLVPHLHPSSILASYSTTPQLFSMALSFLQNQYHLGNWHITKSIFQHEVPPLQPLEHSPSSTFLKDQFFFNMYVCCPWHKSNVSSYIERYLGILFHWPHVQV